MRILHLVHQYPPEYIGGVELNTQLVAEGLAELGHEVSVFYRTAESPLLRNGVPFASPPRQLAPSQNLANPRVWAAYGGAVEPTRRFLATFRNSTLVGLFEQCLSETRPDVVHIQHLMGLPVSLVKRLEQKKIPFVVTLHDYWWLCANAQLLTNDTEEVCDGPRLWINCGRCALARAGDSSFVGRQLWLAPTMAPLFAYRHRLLHYILRQAAQLIVPTAFTQDVYAGIGMIERQKVQIIPNGIKVPAATTFHEQVATHQDSEQKRLHIAYVGGIAQQKGVHLLIKAVTELPVEAVRLSIYGDTTTFPDYVAELRQMASLNVEFMGRVPNDLLLSQLANADLLVVPSIWYETAAIVIQEAYAAGVPVIASDLGALRDRVRHEIDGLRFPAGNWQALRDALRRLLEEPSLLTRLRRNIQMNDTIENQVKAIEAVYQRVLNSGDLPYCGVCR